MLKNRHHSNYDQISVHANKLQPMTENQWGWFLAGLIDGDGHFNKLGYLSLVFDGKDVATAYEVKRYLGYGKLSPIRGKSALTYVLSHAEGRARVAALVKNKLRHKEKFTQYNTRFVPKLNLPPSAEARELRLNNHWLAGFIQSDGSFALKALQRPHRKNTEFRLSLQIDQKERYLLDEIKACLGGSIGFRHGQNTFYFSTVSFKNVVPLINYLDTYAVRGAKQTVYKMWRQAYVLIQTQAHLSPRGAPGSTFASKSCFKTFFCI